MNKIEAIQAAKNTGLWYVYNGKEGVILPEEQGTEEFYSFDELTTEKLVEAIEDEELRPLYLDAYAGETGHNAGEVITQGLMRNVENKEYTLEVWETLDAFRLEREEIEAERAQAEKDEAEQEQYRRIQNGE